ncbi:hypothetical protein L210DRAFT_3547401 [Boletus edulis BED1]|uniref:Uncharacterized protein n=1 Tax=Boletus edulis BED1 TaxID=1328754 RepID=A0AAD4BRB7_BOLED|nr:hypothetical protein L210DRAFT_3547401 [Boletus edulis BED1]
MMSSFTLGRHPTVGSWHENTVRRSTPPPKAFLLRKIWRAADNAKCLSQVTEQCKVNRRRQNNHCVLDLSPTPAFVSTKLSSATTRIHRQGFRLRLCFEPLGNYTYSVGRLTRSVWWTSARVHVPIFGGGRPHPLSNNLSSSAT